MKTENTQAAAAAAEVARTVEINYRKYCAVGICATVRRGNLATEALEYSLALRELKESGRYKMRPFASALAGTRNIDHVFDDYTGDTYSHEAALIRAEKLAKVLDIDLLQEESEALAKWREQQKQKEAENGEKKAEPAEKVETAKAAPITLAARVGKAISADKKATSAEKMNALADCMAAYDKPLAEVVKLALMERDSLAALAEYAAEAVKLRAMSETEKAAEKAKAEAEAAEKRRAALAAAVGMKAQAKREMAAEEREAAALALKNADRLEGEAAALVK